jgi:YbgC/YbaW family acyl-CoA thioester hydrolase
MTDQPPPPSDKKPRRRSAPRKRAPAKRTKADAAPATDLPEAPAEVSTAAHDAVASPEAMAERLDPAPLVDAGDRGDAPASDMPSAPADASDGVPPAGTPTHPSRAKGRRDADTKAGNTRNEAAASPTAAADGTRVDAQRAAAPASADPGSAPFPRQAELRPGELIRVPLSVRWRDLDAFNHVNNSKYLSYLEEARLRWMLAMPGMGMDDNVAPVVAASTLNYRRPIEWPGEVVIELFVERIGGSSLTIGHRIVDSKDGGTLYCDGNVVMVWIDRNSGRSAPLPESVRAACR